MFIIFTCDLKRKIWDRCRDLYLFILDIYIYIYLWIWIVRFCKNNYTLFVSWKESVEEYVYGCCFVWVGDLGGDGVRVFRIVFFFLGIV